MITNKHLRITRILRYTATLLGIYIALQAMPYLINSNFSFDDGPRITIYHAPQNISPTSADIRIDTDRPSLLGVAAWVLSGALIAVIGWVAAPIAANYFVKHWATIRRLGCSIGLHEYRQTNAFERTCPHCKAEFVADYFKWRETGHPKWVKLRTKHER